MSSSDAPVIEAHGLTRRFGDFVAVDHVHLAVPQGCIFAFLGANGSGKTTTMRMLIGLLTPTEGTISTAGVDVIAHPRAVRDAIGYMGQRVSLYRGLTLMENVEFYGGLQGLEGKRLASRWGTLAERFGLERVAADLSDDLPAGLRQRAGLALAMLHEPRVLFLDEPTAGVDIESRALFWDLIREHRREGVTVFVTTHFLDEVDYCDLVSFIDAGRIVVEAEPEELRARFSDGYRVHCPVPQAQRRQSATALGEAGWTVTATEGGLDLRAARATSAMLAAVATAAGRDGAGAVRVEQPSMSDVFGRILRRSEAETLA